MSNAGFDTVKKAMLAIFPGWAFYLFAACSAGLTDFLVRPGQGID